MLVFLFQPLVKFYVFQQIAFILHNLSTTKIFAIIENILIKEI